MAPKRTVISSGCFKSVLKDLPENPYGRAFEATRNMVFITDRTLGDAGALKGDMLLLSRTFGRPPQENSYLSLTSLLGFAQGTLDAVDDLLKPDAVLPAPLVRQSCVDPPHEEAAKKIYALQQLSANLKESGKILTQRISEGKLPSETTLFNSMMQRSNNILVKQLDARVRAIRKIRRGPVQNAAAPFGIQVLHA